MQEHPSLVASHSFANCLPHQVKIKEMEGTIAYDVMKNNCAPFFRRVISVVGEGNVCNNLFTHIALNLYFFKIFILGVHLRNSTTNFSIGKCRYESHCKIIYIILPKKKSLNFL
jgi:hypothetical protein